MLDTGPSCSQRADFFRQPPDILVACPIGSCPHVTDTLSGRALLVKQGKFFKLRPYKSLKPQMRQSSGIEVAL